MINIQYDQFLLRTVLVAKRAGDAILEVYNSDFAVEQKDDKSPLTLADKRSHEVIVGMLKKRIKNENAECRDDYSSMPILSEEGRDIPFEDRRKWEYYWLVDPLDGTKEFVKRNGEFTVNIALMQRNRPVLGCIYVPVQDIFYFAAEGLGSYKLEDSEKVTDDLSVKELFDISRKLPLKKQEKNDTSCDNKKTNGENTPLTIIGSRSHTSKEVSEFVEHIKKQFGGVEFISAGSSLKFCLVAEGKADIYPRFGPTMEWDTAAGHVIVEQASGEVIDVHTKAPLQYNKRELLNPFFIVSREHLSSELEYVC
ncbi:MAG: 3'(2'),5'-bisphosphate nucleotidase CysQ [Candidatus Brocadiaceae bacterium]|nr:3'(2'),5'-bisphosphate nucleotidase CysQ [Candidatus Brocadiaceae bacterium]